MALDKNGQFVDEKIKCIGCGGEFVHSAADQERFERQQYANKPKRCPACREKRRAEAEREKGTTPARAKSAGVYDMVCSACHENGTVPFKPVEGRPVYCRDCYREIRTAESRG